MKPGRRTWAALAAGLATIAVVVLAADPKIFLALHIGLPLAVLCGLAGYLWSRRWSDALVLGVPVLFAQWIERDAGAYALVCLALPLFVLTRRPRFSMLVGGALLGLLLAGVFLKFRFAGSRLTLQDVQFFFLQFWDNIGVMATQPTLLLWAGGVTLALGMLITAGWIWDGRARAAARPADTRAAALLACALVVWCGVQIEEETRRSQQIGAWVIEDEPFLATFPVSGFLSTSMMRPDWQPLPAPTGDFQYKVRKQMAVPGSPSLADMVVVLQESQFNPATIENCQPALCQFPIFAAAPDTAAYGPLRVHVFGGGTWLSEFALSSGVPHTVFGPSGGFASFNVAPGIRRSFVRSLKAAGYRTVAVYPVRGGMMNARLAYGGYGFDKFYDAKDLSLPGNFATPDAAMHEAALRVLAEERKHGKPVLLMLVTIFNHSEHGTRMERVPPALLEATRSAFADEREARSMADYLWRTQQFAGVADATRAAVLRGPRPAVFAWFGDHQPPFGTAIALRSRVRSVEPRIPARYQTWYHISSNRPAMVPARTTTPVDIVFLPGLLAQVAAVPLDDWLGANVTAREQCGGLLVECLKPSVRDAYLTYIWQDLKAFELP